jgi:hypothetical protein
MAGYSAWITVQGVRSGTIEPMAKGLSLTFEREAQPAAFWAAAVWNCLLVGACLCAAAFSAVGQ